MKQERRFVDDRMVGTDSQSRTLVYSLQVGGGIGLLGRRRGH